MALFVTIVLRTIRCWRIVTGPRRLIGRLRMIWRADWLRLDSHNGFVHFARCLGCGPPPQFHCQLECLSTFCLISNGFEVSFKVIKGHWNWCCLHFVGTHSYMLLTWTWRWEIDLLFDLHWLQVIIQGHRRSSCCPHFANLSHAYCFCKVAVETFVWPWTEYDRLFQCNSRSSKVVRRSSPLCRVSLTRSIYINVIVVCFLYFLFDLIKVIEGHMSRCNSTAAGGASIATAEDRGVSASSGIQSEDTSEGASEVRVEDGVDARVERDGGVGLVMHGLSRLLT